MKTRRILAASTAALLAFGTTAAYVASAAAVAAETTGAITWTESNCTLTVKAGVTAAAATAISSGDTVETKSGAADGDNLAAGDCEATGNKLFISVAAAAGYQNAKFTVTVNGTAATYTSAGLALAKDDVVVITATATPKPVVFGATLDSEGEWEEFAKVANGATGTSIGADVAYKMTEAALEKNSDWTMKVQNKNGELTTYTAIKDKDNGIFKNISSTTAKSVINEYDDGKLAVLDFSVGMPDDEDWVDVGSTKLPAAVSLRVSGLGFKPKHVYHYESGKLVELEGRQIKLTEDGNTGYGIEFSTKSFSPFVFSENAVKGAVAVDDKTNPETSGNVSNAATSNAGTSSNPNTGIALAIAPVVLAAGAVAVVALKKKH